MRNTKAISLQVKQKIVEYIQEGHTVPQAQEHFNIHSSTIYKILKIYNVNYITKRKLDKAQIEQYLNENPYLRLKDYAAAFSVSVSGMHQFLNKHGIKYKTKWHNK